MLRGIEEGLRQFAPGSYARSPALRVWAVHTFFYIIVKV